MLRASVLLTGALLSKAGTPRIASRTAMPRRHCPRCSPKTCVTSRAKGGICSVVSMISSEVASRSATSCGRSAWSPHAVSMNSSKVIVGARRASTAKHDGDHCDCHNQRRHEQSGQPVPCVLWVENLDAEKYDEWRADRGGQRCWLERPNQ